MRRSGTGLVYHLSQHQITCTRCGASWQERFVGVATATTDGLDPLCPRCLPLPLTVDILIEAEAKCALTTEADPAEVHRAVAARYAEFLAPRRDAKRTA
jgi:hypothetical protein